MNDGKGINVLNGTVLQDFLGAEGVDELRNKVIELIVDQIRDELSQSYTYIISPDDISNDIYKEVLDGIVEEIKVEYKEKVAEAVQKRLNGLLGVLPDESEDM